MLSTKSLLNKRLLKNPLKKVFPSKQQGNDGDLQLARISGKGEFLLGKIDGNWFSTKLTSIKDSSVNKSKKIKTSKLYGLGGLALTLVSESISTSIYAGKTATSKANSQPILKIGNGKNTGIVSSLGNQDLLLTTGNSTSSYLNITDGSNGSITSVLNGSGKFDVIFNSSDANDPRVRVLNVGSGGSSLDLIVSTSTSDSYIAHGYIADDPSNNRYYVSGIDNSNPNSYNINFTSGSSAGDLTPSSGTNLVKISNDGDMTLLKDLFVTGDATVDGGRLDIDKSSGDPKLVFQIGGTSKFTVGLDDSDSDKFKINSGSTMADPSDLELDSSGNLNIAGTFTIGTINTDTAGDNYLVEVSGEVKKRTPAEVLSDIGGSSTTGTVTSVGATGTVNGLTLTGTVTSSGNLTLGGTLAINNGDWSGTDLAVANGGTGASNSNAWLNSRITTNANGSLNYDATGATAVNHNSLTGYDADEHIDWTSASAGTIDASNYTNTTYSVMASGNSYAAGLVAAGSGTHGSEFLRKDGTWVVPTNTTYSIGDGGLTTNDFTNDDHTKLNGIAAGAEVNVQADWDEASSGSDAFIANKPTIPAAVTNHVTNNADDTMAGTLTIDKDSTATTNGVTKALSIDYDHTGITASGQSINNVGLDINITDSSPTHVGTHTNYGIKMSTTSNTSGTGSVYGIQNTATGGDTNVGYMSTVTNGGNDFILHDSADGTNYATISTGADGATTIETVDDSGAAGHLTLDPDGDLLISGADVMIDAGKKLYLDGDGHTYFLENSDDVLHLFVGGTQIYSISELGVNSFFEMMAGGGMSIPFQAPLYLDGGANTYIKSNTADQISLHCGAATVFTIAEDGATNGDYASFGTTGAGFTQFEPTYNATDTYVYFNRNGNKAHLTFGAASTAITDIHMHFPPVSGNFQLLIKQHGSGGGSVTNWKTFDKAGSNESTVVWPAATAPTLTTGANKIDIISVYWDADNNKAYGVASLNF